MFDKARSRMLGGVGVFCVLVSILTPGGSEASALWARLNVLSTPFSGISIASTGTNCAGTTDYQCAKQEPISTSLNAPWELQGPTGTWYEQTEWIGCENGNAGWKNFGCLVQVSLGETQTVTAVYEEIQFGEWIIVDSNLSAVIHVSCDDAFMCKASDNGDYSPFQRETQFEFRIMDYHAMVVTLTAPAAVDGIDFSVWQGGQCHGVQNPVCSFEVSALHGDFGLYDELTAIYE